MSINPKIRGALMEMVRKDQHMRMDQWNHLKKVRKLQKDDVRENNRTYRKEIEKLHNALTKLDKRNTDRLKKIIGEHGWPGKSLVGKRGANAAWLLAQHATHDLAFQKECLRHLRAAVRRGEAEKKHLAFLVDRILVQEGKKQVYGSQFQRKPHGAARPFPIKNPRGLDARRKSMGLEPFSQYAKKMS